MPDRKNYILFPAVLYTSQVVMSQAVAAKGLAGYEGPTPPRM